jgi:hypothetical protein
MADATDGRLVLTGVFRPAHAIALWNERITEGNIILKP